THGGLQNAPVSLISRTDNARRARVLRPGDRILDELRFCQSLDRFFDHGNNSIHKVRHQLYPATPHYTTTLRLKQKMLTFLWGLRQFVLPRSERNGLTARKSRLEGMFEFCRCLRVLDYDKIIVLTLKAGR